MFMFWIDRIILWLVAFVFAGATLATQIVLVFLLIEAVWAWLLRALHKRDERIFSKKTIEAWRRQYAPGKALPDGLDGAAAELRRRTNSD